MNYLLPMMQVLRSLFLIILFVVSIGVSSSDAQVVNERKIETETEIKIYPNPATEFFQITYDPRVESLSINNIVGKEVKRLTAYKNEMYDISDLQKGIYILRLLNEDGKVIKAVRLSKR